MFESVAMTGLFQTRDLALRAGEKLREIVGRRGLVRVLFPGTAASVVEVSVLARNNGTFGVAIGGALLGVVGFAGMLAFGSGWRAALLALGWGIATGAVLAWWFTGTTQTARTLRGLDSKRCHELLAGEGESFDGINPWVTVATRTAAPVARSA